MKYIIVLAVLLTACASNVNRVNPRESLANKPDDGIPRWIKLSDGTSEYCDKNICAKSVQEYRWIYNVLEAKYRFE